MLHTILPIIINHVVPLGALGVFLGCLIDETFPVVPATVVLLVAGFFLLHGPFGWALIHSLLFTIALPAAFGLTLGSLVIYTIFYFGGKPVLDRYGKYIGVTWDDVNSLNDRLARTEYDEIFFVLAWVLPIIPSVLFGVFGGTTRMSAKKYATLTFVGTFFKSILIGLVGWSVGAVYLKYADVIDHFETAIGVIIVALIVIYFYYRKSKKKVLQSGANS